MCIYLYRPIVVYILYIRYFYLCARKYIYLIDILLETSIRIYFIMFYKVVADLRSSNPFNALFTHFLFHFILLPVYCLILGFPYHWTVTGNTCRHVKTINFNWHTSNGIRLTSCVFIFKLYRCKINRICVYKEKNRNFLKSIRNKWSFKIYFFYRPKQFLIPIFIK